MPIMLIVGLYGFMEIYETHETLFLMPNIKPDQVNKHS